MLNSGSSIVYLLIKPLEHVRRDTRDKDAQGIYCALTEVRNN